MIDGVIRSASLVLAAVLAFAVAHKLRVLREGDADEQPLLRRRRWPPEVAARVLATVASVEALVAVAVVVVPPIGLIGMAGVLAAYTFELRRLDVNESCGCLGDLLDQAGRAQAIRRNMVLFGVAAGSAAAYLSGAATVGGLTQVDVGVAALVLAVVLARAALARQLNAIEGS
jgi:hypothetical protein